MKKNKCKNKACLTDMIFALKESTKSLIYLDYHVISFYYVSFTSRSATKTSLSLKSQMINIIRKVLFLIEKVG